MIVERVLIDWGENEGIGLSEVHFKLEALMISCYRRTTGLVSYMVGVAINNLLKLIATIKRNASSS